MSYIAGKLKHRIHILQATDEPNELGGFTRGYKKLLTLWSGKKTIGSYLMQIRAVNIDKNNKNSPIDTDEFIVRYDSVISKFNRTFSNSFGAGYDSLENTGLGKSFEGGFDNGFDSTVDMYPIKADYFVFLQSGNSDAYRGRLYRINRVLPDDNAKKWVLLRCSEVEEVGFGAEV